MVLVRRGPSGIRVCLVHRPRQNDWSLPKGKADPGELMPTTARREATEETGSDVLLGAPLRQQRYRVDSGPKTVDYWVAHIRPGGPGFKPNKEVDRIEWMTPAKARARLTYPRDRQLILDALSTPHTSPLVVLRHAEAMRRSDYRGGNDTRRPLTKYGLTQARALVAPLTAFGIARVHSSDSRRCMQTVEPLASHLKAGIVEESLFSEEIFSRRPKTALRRLRSLAVRSAPLVICSHRPVLPDLLATLAQEFSLKVKSPLLRPSLDPGGFIVIHREVGPRNRPTGRVIAVERFDG
ncbi:MAG: hydrolase [Actinomycetota bacterium]|nr:hydrolase [Actinomycetota bacterium]